MTGVTGAVRTPPCRTLRGVRSRRTASPAAPRAARRWPGSHRSPRAHPRALGEGHRAFLEGVTISTVSEVYAEFAAREARGVSPAYELLALAVSRDEEIQALLGTVPPGKRQPNLLFSVVRFLGGPVEDPRLQTLELRCAGTTASKKRRRRIARRSTKRSEKSEISTPSSGCSQLKQCRNKARVEHGTRHQEADVTGRTGLPAYPT